MNKTEIKKSEDYISDMFDKMSGHFDKGDEKGLAETAKRHIDQITEDSSVKTAIDVGSGAGGIVIGLLDKDLDFVYGVDLAPSMVEAAQLRLEKKGYLDKSKIEKISFLDFSFENNFDAVSLHQVLCCHPDRQSMLAKAISAKPKIIVMTLPRTRLFFRLGAGLLAQIRKIKKGFRFYVHDIKKIDNQLAEANYELIDTYKKFFWNTRTYKLKTNKL